MASLDKRAETVDSVRDCNVSNLEANPDKFDIQHKGDDILKNATLQDFQQELSDADAKRIKRKIDWGLIPILIVTFSLQFIDKNTLVDAAVLGLSEDLHLKGQQYSWAGSIFYLGYLAASYPFSYLMVKLPLGKLLATTMVGWAAVLLCTASLRNSGGLLATRFFLGVAESAISPGFNIVTAMWWKREEQTARISAWFLGNAIGGFVGSLIFYGIGHLQSFSPWRAGFLVVGSINLVWGGSMLCFFPDTPMKAWFLTAEESKQAVIRVQDNKTGIKNNTYKIPQALASLKDPLTWIFFAMQLTAAIPNGGITNFSSLIIRGLGFSRLNTLLMKLAMYAFQVMFIGIGVLGTRYFHNSRLIWILIFTLISIAGGLMVRYIPEEQMYARFFGVCLMMSFAASVPMKMSLLSANLGGFTRKAFVNALAYVGYCVGNMIGPQMFRASEAPKYPSGFMGMIGCWVAVFIEALVLLVYLRWENKRRDKAQQANAALAVQDDGDLIGENFMDLTDIENPRFRYVY